MPRLPKRLAAVFVAALPLLTACGGASAESPSERTVQLSEHDLQKVDPKVRARLDSGGAIPVKVFFRSSVDDATLAELLLTRVGSLVIGQLTPDDVKRVASRPDVVRIELLEAGYADG